MENEHIRVWDIPIRLFHWVLVALVTCQFLIAWVFTEQIELHVILGYLTLALIVFRIFWGFIGTTYAQFKNFLVSPTSLVAYTKGLFNQTSQSKSAGHNPIGGYSTIAIIVCILVQAFSGLFCDDNVFTAGPLRRLVSDNVTSIFNQLHALNAKILVGLLCTHVLAIFWYLLVKRENLIKPMITGKKIGIKYDRYMNWTEKPLAALLTLALASIAVWVVINI
jgi:cytochrome b